MQPARCLATVDNLGPDKPLPYSSDFDNPGQYVDSLIDLLASNELLRLLCGGVHVLDFFTSEPDLYSQLLPLEWREFFSAHDILDVLDLLMREDLPTQCNDDGTETETWRGGLKPPSSLLDYIRTVRKHLLLRDVEGLEAVAGGGKGPPKLTRSMAVGMTVKKVHEVGLFASYIAELSTAIAAAQSNPISHLVDFGSGQNYLGRVLASEPYNKEIIAIEGRASNAARAREFDVIAKVSPKDKILRNKKAFRAGHESPAATPDAASTIPERLPPLTPEQRGDGPPIRLPTGGTGRIDYIEHDIQDGDLGSIASQIRATAAAEPNVMVISLHSCGNLVHHGLRSLVLNRSVSAVALVGCCYNLMTERLGPATYKMAALRPTTPAAGGDDPHGFPMSTRFCTHVPQRGRDASPGSSSIGGGDGGDSTSSRGIRLNITARMMAVQAPSNWSAADSVGFFTRHFYRALLQRVFLDRGVVAPPSSIATSTTGPDAIGGGGSTPIIIGSLRKHCYTSFAAYVRGALAKIALNPALAFVGARMAGVTDDEMQAYDEAYRARKHHLSVVWSLMAFSAGVVEAAVVVDRWLWLQEQDEVGKAWVEPVFDYRLSPRNLVVVGVKK